MWSIGEIANTVKISAACARDLFAAQKYEAELWYEPEDVAQDGLLYFNPDHMEGMDWVGREEHLTAVLKKHKVSGDICFGSLEGDNAGQFWGYRFNGRGGMVNLEGRLVWEEKAEPLAGMVFVFTGALMTMSRDEAHARVYDSGGDISTSVTRRVTHVVTGTKPGSKLAKAKRLGITVITEDQFLALMA